LEVRRVLVVQLRRRRGIPQLCAAAQS
jgi:hypothetical protein